VKNRTSARFDLSDAIAANLASKGGEALLHFDSCWIDWKWLREFCDHVAPVFARAHTVGLVARVRPTHIATIAANVRDRRSTAFIYSAQTSSGIASDIRRLRLPVVVADSGDWNETTLRAASEAGSIAVATSESDARIAILSPGTAPVIAKGDPDIAFRLLSSGTTGPPKRVPIRWDTAAQLVANSRTAYVGSDNADAPQIMASPLGNVAGLVYTLPVLALGGRLVLLDRFEPQAWAEAVRDHRPVRGALTPTGVRMVLDAQVRREWLESLQVIGVGGSRLDEELQAEFESRYGIPVLPAYGATEFGGVIANWSVDAYQEWGRRKRGSVGRAGTGVALRVVDQGSGHVLGPGEQGLLEAKVDRIGASWIRTTDLASLDEDGFLFIHGRADGAINRGGFKILPDAVANVVRQHPAVADAAVIGCADHRLGEAPVAAVELRVGQNVSPIAIRSWCRDRMLAYQVPARIVILDALPRNLSGKVALTALKEILSSKAMDQA